MPSPGRSSSAQESRTAITKAALFAERNRFAAAGSQALRTNRRETNAISLTGTAPTTGEERQRSHGAVPSAKPPQHGSASRFSGLSPAGVAAGARTRFQLPDIGNLTAQRIRSYSIAR